MPFESVVTPCSAIDLRTDPNVGNEPQLPVSAECCHLGRHLPNDRYSQRPSPEPAGANTLASLTQPQRQENQCRLMAEASPSSRAALPPCEHRLPATLTLTTGSEDLLFSCRDYTRTTQSTTACSAKHMQAVDLYGGQVRTFQ